MDFKCVVLTSSISILSMQLHASDPARAAVCRKHQAEIYKLQDAQDITGLAQLLPKLSSDVLPPQDCASLQGLLERKHDQAKREREEILQELRRLDNLITAASITLATLEDWKKSDNHLH